VERAVKIFGWKRKNIPQENVLIIQMILSFFWNKSVLRQKRSDGAIKGLKDIPKEYLLTYHIQ